MLRTTNKLVINRLKSHILDNFAPEYYGGGDSAIENLKHQIKSMQYAGRSLYATGIDYAEGGGLLVYTQDVRDFLEMILEETPQEADRYDDNKVWRLYCHLVARTIANICTEGK